MHACLHDVALIFVDLTSVRLLDNVYKFNDMSIFSKWMIGIFLTHQGNAAIKFT